MTTPLTDLGLTIPLIAAPMAGGGTKPGVVVAAAHAGGLGFLAGGYKTADALRDEIRAVRSASVPFGVNLFAPNEVAITPSAYRDYAVQIQREADRFGITLPAGPIDDDDAFGDKVDLLLAEPVPIVSFTFGIPDARVVTSLQKAGTIVVQTVTSPQEAELATGVGVDMLAVQAAAAGGHSGTLTPDRLPEPVPLTELLARVADRTSLTLVAAGGVATPADVTAALAAGADAVAVGTALLRSDESGASATHVAALTDPRRTETVLTRAFTGRPARGLRNKFIDRFEPVAPLGYPAVHHLTSPLRKAAAAAGDAELVHLWAGTGYRRAQPRPTAEILRYLAGEQN